MAREPAGPEMSGADERGVAELNVWRYPRDGAGQQVESQGVGASGGGVIWVDFRPGADYESLGDAFDAMQLQGLQKAMLGFLVSCVDPTLADETSVPWYDPDETARVVAGTDVRYLHAFSLMPDVGPGPLGAGGELPMVYRRDVHFLASDHWVITRRREGMGVTRGMFDQERDPVPFDDLRRLVESRWDDYHEPQDVATLILRALAGSWLPALERITGRLANSELLYVQGLVEDRSLIDSGVYRRDLVDLKWIVDGLSSAFVALRRPAVPAKAAWFETKTPRAEVIAKEIEQLHHMASEELARHREQVRNSFDLVAATEASRQLELASEERHRGERLEGAVTLITAVVLVPTLIAGVFAALPDALKEHSHLRLWLLLGLMVAAAALTWFGLRLLQPGARKGGLAVLTGEGSKPDEEKSNGDGEAIIPSPVFVLSFLFAALLVIGCWRARDREQALGVVLLSISAFLIAPHLIATPWLVAVERALFGRFERKAENEPGRTRKALRFGRRLLEAALWIGLVVFAALIIDGTWKLVWPTHSVTLLTVGFALAPVLYFGFLLLWMTYAFTAAVGADASDMLTRELVGVDQIKEPLIESAVAGALATLFFLAGTALAYYSAWHH